MALQPSAVYHKMLESFSLFEEGKLKGQKVHDMKGATLIKVMEESLLQSSPTSKSFKDCRYSTPVQ